MNFDVVIIGGGLAGLTCGIALQEQGKRCVIINNGQAAIDFASGSLDLLSRLPNGAFVKNIPENLTALQTQNLIVAQYIDSHLNVTETYPANPNGSALGITAISNVDGRIAAMMPHPERVFRAVSNSWYPEDWSEDGAWMRIFRNARVNFK